MTHLATHKTLFLLSRREHDLKITNKPWLLLAYKYNVHALSIFNNEHVACPQDGSDTSKGAK